MNTGKIKETLYTALSTFGTVYFRVASSSSIYPFIVYDIPMITNDLHNPVRKAMITVDIYGEDFTAIEAISDNILTLDSTLLQNDDSIQIFVENMQYLDSKENVHRKRVNLECRIVGN